MMIAAERITTLGRFSFMQSAYSHDHVTLKRAYQSPEPMSGNY